MQTVAVLAVLFEENLVILASDVLSQYTRVTDDDDKRQITTMDSQRSAKKTGDQIRQSWLFADNSQH